MDNKLRQDNVLKDFLSWFGSTRAGAWTIINIGTRVDRWLIKFTNGSFNSTFAWPCLLLTTKGAKTGLERTVALVYLEDGNNLILIASKGGNLKHPSWYLNLMANPEAEVFIDGVDSRYIASDAEGQEHDRLWQKALEIYSGYEKYQQRAGDRRIPIVILRPLD
ncbi:MAG: nitroreductase family deazaflavin-dependent oxidoreductase [Thermodesulfobacteriota bacterium]